MKRKSYLLDTTILTDALLKPDSFAARSRTQISSELDTVLPVYAIKEFEWGPLQNFIYVCNKLAETRSLSGTLAALAKLARTPQRYKTSTAIEALSESCKALRHEPPDEEGQASADELNAAQLRENIGMVIRVAWRHRRKVASRTDFELACYREEAPQMDGELWAPRRKCDTGSCAMNEHLAKVPSRKLVAVRRANRQRHTDEGARCEQALEAVSQRRLSSEECRRLGDGAFALLSIRVGPVLTTNIRDHEPLCQAAGQRANLLEDVLPVGTRKR